MEVNLNIRREIKVQDNTPAPERHELVKLPDNAKFERTEAVDRALEANPRERAEAIAQGEGVLRTVQYPPPEVIKRISRLLARNWPSSEE